MATASSLSELAPGQRSRSGPLRRALKRGALAVAWILVSPLILLARIEALLCGRDCERVFGAAKESLSLLPGVGGQFLRLAFYCSTCRAVSPDACFAFGSMVSSRDVGVGAGTVVGAYSIVGPSEIGEDVLIASRASVFSDRYEHGHPADRARGDTSSDTFSLISIGNGCWIGENAIVMSSIGARCTVSAGAVVVREAPAGQTLMGNPARRANL